ncbi:MAG TPA: hypothetical protein VFW95_05625 [Candidatus Limnocylindria bacterium]|nr:hypothetical protein [Candidatus Limnocylindria bacterium]
MLTRRTFPVVLAVLLLALTACGSRGGGGGGGGGAESDLPRHAEASSDDAEGTTFELQEGRYRVSVTAPGCSRPVVQVNSVDGAFTYEMPIATYNAFINGMIEGEYTITITSDCDEWTVVLDKF